MYLVLMQILKSFLGLVCPYLGPKIMQLDASQKNLKWLKLGLGCLKINLDPVKQKCSEIYFRFFFSFSHNFDLNSPSNVGYEFMTYP